MFRGMYLMVFNNSFVVQNETLCFDCFSINECISLIGGYTAPKNIISNLNLENNNETWLINSSGAPMVYIKAGINVLNCTVNVYKSGKLLIKPGRRINTFNALFGALESKVNASSSFSEEGLSKLSRLFENKIVNKNDSVIAHSKSILRHSNNGNAISSLKTYVIDPICVLEKPIIYHMNNGECPLDNNAIIHLGDSIISGNLSFNDYINTYGFNEFVNYFINIIQEIYDSQGINVNSKHIEVILKQMTNIVTILDSGDTPFDNGEDYK